MFDYIGLFSAAILPDKAVKSPVYEDMEGKLRRQFEKAPALYWIAIGNTDFLYKVNQDYRKMLDENGYKYTYYESPEGHIWKNWRKTGESISPSSSRSCSNEHQHQPRTLKFYDMGSETIRAGEVF